MTDTQKPAVSADDGAGVTPKTGGELLPYWNRINHITTDQPWIWLEKGWQDYRKSFRCSMFYGLIFVLIGFGLTVGLYLLDYSALIVPLVEGYLIVGPALSLGLYDLSRQIENGEKPSLKNSLLAWRRNRYHILTAGLIMMLFMMIWLRFAVILFAMMFPYVSMDLASIAKQALFTVDGLAFLVVGSAIGGVFAAGAFVAAVISLPAMLDQKIDIFTAVIISVIAVMKNPKPMFLWAMIVLLFIGGGLASFYIGLIVTLPLIGFSTWHAYRALFIREEDMPKIET